MDVSETNYIEKRLFKMFWQNLKFDGVKTKNTDQKISVRDL